MRILLLLVSVVFQDPQPAPKPPILVVAENVQVGNLVRAYIDATKLEWAVWDITSISNARTLIDLENSAPQGSEIIGQRIAFTGLADDYRVVAFIKPDGQPPVRLVQIITIEGARPPPGPGPGPGPGPLPDPDPPKPPIVEGHLWVMYFADANTLTPQQAALKADETLKQELLRLNMNWRYNESDSDYANSANNRSWGNKLGYPFVLIMDDKGKVVQSLDSSKISSESLKSTAKMLRGQ